MNNDSYDIEYLLKHYYNIEHIVSIKKNDVGTSDNYKIETNSKKYFFKMENKNRESIDFEKETEVCSLLNSKGIPCSKFIINNNNKYVSYIDDKIFHLQNFIEGDVWKHNTAPEWLMKEGIILLAKIHNLLEREKLQLHHKFVHLNNLDLQINKVQRCINHFNDSCVPEKAYILVMT